MKKQAKRKVRMLAEPDQPRGSSTQIPGPQQRMLTPQTNPSNPEVQSGGTQSQPVDNPARVYPANGIGESASDLKQVAYVHRKPVGATGTKSYSGYPREDYLDIMHGKNKALLFDQMWRSDSAIKMCTSAVVNPIKAASYEVQPADQDNADYVTHAEYANWILFENSDKPFDEFIQETMTMVRHGHAVFEQIDKIVLNDPVWGNAIGIKDLGFRSQKTIERWYLDGENGELTGIMQLSYGDVARNVTIPAYSLVIFTLDKEGSNYEGVSLYRPAYGAWWRKDNYMKMNAIGIERFAIPTPFVEIPVGKENGPQYDSLIQALEVYTNHQANWLTYPEGWKIDVKTSSYDPEKVEKSIDAEDKRIAKAFLGNFLELGMGGAGTGNRAMSEQLKKFFVGGIVFLANEFCGTVSKRIIKRAIDLKFGPQSKYPFLKASGIEDEAGKEFGELMKALCDSQVITPDDVLEEHTRKRIGLPKMSLKGQRAVKAVGAAGIDGPANPPVNQLSERIILAELRRRSLLLNEKSK